MKTKTTHSLSNMLTRTMRKLGKMDPVLYGAVILLNLMGLVSIISITDVLGNDRILIRQAAGSAVGIILMTVLSTVNYRKITCYYKALYLIVIISLAAVFIFGSSGGGAKRWISLGGITFQPSELAKILLILFYSEFIINYVGKLSRIKLYALSALLILPPFIMILKEPDLSTSIMVLVIFCVIIFISGLDWKIIAGVAAAAVPAFMILMFAALSGEFGFLGEYQRQRILAWLHPEDYAATTAYQTMNSMTAIGSGRLIGKGITAGASGTVLGTGFISESQTDFIFAVIGEQFGFLGCCIMLVLITIVTARCFKAASESRDPADRIVASGMAGWIGFQSYLNIGVTTGLLPNTGIPLPFVSYGLTSLICLYAGLGLGQNICIKNKSTQTTRRSNT